MDNNTPKVITENNVSQLLSFGKLPNPLLEGEMEYLLKLYKRLTDFLAAKADTKKENKKSNEPNAKKTEQEKGKKNQKKNDAKRLSKQEKKVEKVE